MTNLHDGYAKRLLDLYSETRNTRQRLIKQVSIYDKALSAYYHELEKQVISPAESFEYLVALQNILIKRRTVKQELYHIDVIERSLRESVEKFKHRRGKAIKRTSDYDRTLNVNITINDVM
ncbi:hypothetical protein [Sporosarcina sp. D27]|uniref:hypothetical protein n=1 Tax=Sporosarcina sp. D27 TaxID=1382305 RepID=UPI00046E5783|nr:hypothetical protein [Sporosarcina sp. D27]